MNRFEYFQPATLQEAVNLLGREGQNILPMGGGSDLLGLIKHQILSPDALVNLKGIAGLDTISYTAGKGLRIGSQVKVVSIAENAVIRQKYPALSEAAAEVASPQLRNMGTLGGNLCQRPHCWYFRGDFNCLRKGGDTCFAALGENKYHCITGGDPCFIVHPSDLAVALLALNATISIMSGSSNRTIPLNDFFVLPSDDVMHENILKPGEIITEVFVPELPQGSVSGYIKFRERAAWDFAVVSVAAVLQKSGRKILNGRIALGGVAPRPWLETNVSNLLSNFTVNPGNIEAAAQAALKDAVILEKNDYKIQLTKNLIKRLLNRLTE